MASEVKVWSDDARWAGDCNGCTERAGGTVWVMSLRGSELRVCPKCLETLRRLLDLAGGKSDGE